MKIKNIIGFVVSVAFLIGSPSVILAGEKGHMKLQHETSGTQHGKTKHSVMQHGKKYLTNAEKKKEGKPEHTMSKKHMNLQHKKIGVEHGKTKQSVMQHGHSPMMDKDDVDVGEEKE